MFKPGDRVVCLRDIGQFGPRAGGRYTVNECEEGWLTLGNSDLAYNPDAFTLSRDCTGPATHTTLPLDSSARKQAPLYDGPVRYFPAALVEVSKVCKIGNDKHNPGQPMHHARGKSVDHANCILRHMVDLSEDMGKGVGLDENGIPQVAYIAWRALALAQEWLEARGAPLAPGAKVDGQ